VSGRLDDALVYLVAPAQLRAGRLADLVSELVDAGVGIVQLREKEAEAGDVIRMAEPVLAACREAGIPFIVNDRPDIAAAIDADGVHVGQNDLPATWARRIVGKRIVGLSSHAEQEIDAALALGKDIDYLVAGPVHETPTKRGRPGTGLGLIRYAAERVDIPWFAIGGIDARALPGVLEAGARRIVVVRAITEAADPPAAAAELHALLS
jgi:thiamine-phosphate pyrophosphorylase